MYIHSISAGRVDIGRDSQPISQWRNLGAFHSPICRHQMYLSLNPASLCFPQSLCLYAAPLCPDLVNPTDGSVQYTTLTPGSVATYTCNDGYQAVGEVTRTCETNGTWTGDSPVCENGKKSDYFICAGCAGNLTLPSHHRGVHCGAGW